MLARLTLLVFLLAAAPGVRGPLRAAAVVRRCDERVAGARCALGALLDNRWSLRPGQEQWAVGESCTDALPRALHASFGRSEACWSQAVQSLTGSRAGEESAYLCSLLANPGTEARPNAASWRCGRISVNHDRGAREDAVWTADGGRLRAPQDVLDPEAVPRPRLILGPGARPASRRLNHDPCRHPPRSPPARLRPRPRLPLDPPTPRSPPPPPLEPARG